MQKHLTGFQEPGQNRFCKTITLVAFDDTLGIRNRPFSFSEKECGSNDISSQSVEFSNMQNGDRSSNAIQSNLAHQNV